LKGISLEITQIFKTLTDGFYFLGRKLLFVLTLGNEIPQYIDDKLVDTAESASLDDRLDLLIKRTGNL